MRNVEVGELDVRKVGYLQIEGIGYPGKIEKVVGYLGKIAEVVGYLGKIEEVVGYSGKIEEGVGYSGKMDGVGYSGKMEGVVVLDEVGCCIQNAWVD